MKKEEVMDTPTKTDISEIPYHKRYKTDKEGYRWVMLEEAKREIESTKKDVERHLFDSLTRQNLELTEMLRNQEQANKGLQKGMRRKNRLIKRLRSRQIPKGWEIGDDGNIYRTDGWIPWDGGECPVDTFVDLKFRDGDIVYDTHATNWDWSLQPEEYLCVEIAAYRISQEAKEQP